MDKFKMELTWHNCATCPPEECFNSYLLVTDGWDIQIMIWDELWGGFRNRNLEVKGTCMIKYWWADIAQTVHKTHEFREELN